MIHVDISKLYNLSSCSLLCCGPKKTKKGGEENGGRVKLKNSKGSYQYFVSPQSNNVINNVSFVVKHYL